MADFFAKNEEILLSLTIFIFNANLEIYICICGYYMAVGDVSDVR